MAAAAFINLIDRLASTSTSPSVTVSIIFCICWAWNLAANESHHYALHWLLTDGEYGLRKLASANGLWLQPFGSKLPDSKLNIQMGITKGNRDFSIVRADPNSTRGWRSRYYGHKEPAISVMLEADQPQVTFWTFFGFEDDVLDIAGNTLKINSKNFLLVE